MKKIIIGAIALLSFGIEASAQQPAPAQTKTVQTSKKNKAAKAGKLKEALNLTAEQETKVREVVKKFRDDRKALHDNTTMSKQDKKEKIAQLTEERNNALKSILTPEQLVKFQELQTKQNGSGKRNSQNFLSEDDD